MTKHREKHGATTLLVTILILVSAAFAAYVLNESGRIGQWTNGFQKPTQSPAPSPVPAPAPTPPTPQEDTPSPTVAPPAPKKPTPTPVEPKPEDPFLPMPGLPRSALDQGVTRVEHETTKLINEIRSKLGLPITVFDPILYKFSKAHTQNMADAGKIFHSSQEPPLFSEITWGDSGYNGYSASRLANVIVVTWMQKSPDRKWLLHSSIKKSAVSIVNRSNGQYASFTYRIEESQLPSTLEGESDIYTRKTGEKVTWPDWLRQEGYLR
jgi:uncharacterized protein YkwD